MTLDSAEYKQREHDRAVEAVKALTTLVNNMSMHPAEFVQEMLSQHRTLQQSVMRLFIDLCKGWASLEPGQYDMRNEDAVKLAKQIVQLNESLYIRYV